MKKKPFIYWTPTGHSAEILIASAKNVDGIKLVRSDLAKLGEPDILGHEIEYKSEYCLVSLGIEFARRFAFEPKKIL